MWKNKERNEKKFVIKYVHKRREVKRSDPCEVVSIISTDVGNGIKSFQWKHIQAEKESYSVDEHTKK